MTGLESDLARLARTIAELGIRSALVGGLAVSVRTEPRFTRDIDLAIAVADDSGAEQTTHAFLARGYALVAQIEQEATARLATVRTRAPDGGVVVDLLFASSGIEPEIVTAADPLEVIPGIVLPTARVGHLIAMKLLSRDDRSRPQDGADLRALLAVADREQLDLAREACALISARGFQRDRDLAGLLALAIDDA